LFGVENPLKRLRRFSGFLATHGWPGLCMILGLLFAQIGDASPRRNSTLLVLTEGTNTTRARTQNVRHNGLPSVSSFKPISLHKFGKNGPCRAR
jgi:hypothetical protein